MKLILASRDDMSREDYVWVKWALDNGVDYFWMRNPEEWELHEKFLLGLFSGYGPRIRVASELKHPHRKHFKSGFSSDYFYHSCSVHDQEEWEQRKKLGIKEAFVSPCFPSISKAPYGEQAQISNFNWVAEVKEEAEFFALGGIDEAQIPLVPDHFSGVVVLGSVWNSEDKSNKIKSLAKLCKS